MRSIWNGAIGFGLVNIPVKMYSAVEDSNLDLDMLDKSDFSNIKFKRVNEKTGKEVKWENIVKGYLLEDKYIVLDAGDYTAASPEKTRIFSIEQFVKEAEIDSVFFEVPYFLEPQKNAENAYNLLLKALQKTKMAGIGTFVMRDKEIFGMIRPYDDKVLIINRLRFAQEIRDYKDLKIPDQKSPKEGELKMAVSLIEQNSEKFEPTAFKDTYAEDLMKIIKQKAKGGKVKKIEEQAEDSGKVVDLMAQLKASLENSKKNKKVS
ncbi:Ku protein [Chryseobacterium sp. MDT2-18]|uniref:non-homologous end joining protein Ku n=1 Tax=Chryseobacterium sp. MDT2-18 TaxID=1259136 RepID=UPI002786633B|nr:Ku protein [Chryseobacterium sp. MDT2-18]MDQ0475792.1 DNA end-binding protein Ku [Chryseobacterium sp. MDT2-18]